MDACDLQSSFLVNIHCFTDGIGYGFCLSVGNIFNCSKMNVPGYRMKKWDPLHVKNINTECDVLVKLQDVGWNWLWCEHKDYKLVLIDKLGGV